ncbi:hypothetical protein PoB_005859900 [Plakobranchus ocellatus]|uniref:C3H1-type domain-containing protein n=1 Tax=Plakobranchus ocellatus TaxID=259542 RepID=A0AAV4CLD7_9GAST|nr:hypothetical protein PoB_005859900 [Plakobranchus ocellatus]
MLVCFGGWKNKQCTVVQCSFRHIHHNNPPANNSICVDFIERGCICDQRKGHPGRPAVQENVVDRVRDNYLRCFKKSTHNNSTQQLQLPQRTVCKTLCKCLRFTSYKLQLSKSYTRETKKRALNLTKLSRSRWNMILICCQR